MPKNLRHSPAAASDVQKNSGIVSGPAFGLNGLSFANSTESDPRNDRDEIHEGVLRQSPTQTRTAGAADLSCER
jgi:hypothetical protein